MLKTLFIVIVNMSITAGIAAGLLLLIRLVFRDRMPKWLGYAAWSIVLVRLLLPVSFAFLFSVFAAVTPVADTQTTLIADANFSTLNFIESEPIRSFISDLPFLLNTVTNSMPAEINSANYDRAVTYGFDAKALLAGIWLAVCVGLAGMSVYFHGRNAKALGHLTPLDENETIRRCRELTKTKRAVPLFSSALFAMPVAFGVFRPKIILPADFDLRDEEALRHIVTHELIHIKRHDNLIKTIAFLAVCVHWFNPIVWAAYFAALRDMETSCDEQVLAVSRADDRKAYAGSLLRMKVRQDRIPISATILAFGESSMKQRIRDVMRFRKSRVITIVLSVLVLLLAGCLILSNPVKITPAPAVSVAGSNFNNSRVVQVGNWVYYSNAFDGGKLYKVRSDGTYEFRMTGRSSVILGIYKRWIYCLDPGDGNSLYRIQTDDKGEMTVTDDRVDRVFIAGDWIYYDVAGDGIYRIRTDGSRKTELWAGSPGSMFMSGRSVFYTDSGDGGSLYSIRSDGASRVKIKDGPVTVLDVNGQRIYYQTEAGTGIRRMNLRGGDDAVILADGAIARCGAVGDWIYFNDGGIFRIRSDGSERTRIGGADGGDFVVYDNRIYLLDTTEQSIFRIGVDGSDLVRLNDDRCADAVFSGGGIFYCNLSDGGKLYFIRTDGSGRVCLQKGME